jgi:hypothetical protein
MANLDKAKINVWEFVEEVVQRFKVGQGGREGDNETLRGRKCRMNGRFMELKPP